MTAGGNVKGTAVPVCPPRSEIQSNFISRRGRQPLVSARKRPEAAVECPSGADIFFRESKCAIFCIRSVPPLHSGCSFYHSSFFFLARRYPSEKSINLARGFANVRTIRQRADWRAGVGFGRGGRADGQGEKGTYAAKPVSGERCSFVPHAIKPRRFYERGEPDDEVIYLPVGKEGRRDDGDESPRRDSLQGASIASIKVAAFLPRPVPPPDATPPRVIFVPARGIFDPPTAPFPSPVRSEKRPVSICIDSGADYEHRVPPPVRVRAQRPPHSRKSDNVLDTWR